MATFRVALIGTGRVGAGFRGESGPANHAEAVRQNARCELAAGVNRGREKLEAYGRRFAVEALYHDHRRMLEEIHPDICIVATHPEQHADMVIDCAQAPSTRAVICEKPMALSLEECDRMINACDRAGVRLQINHNRRWNREYVRGLDLLREGAIGELRHIYAYMDGGKPAPDWRSAHEGPLLHDFTHYFDLVDMFGGAVEWLCGMAEQRARPWAVEDFSAAFMKLRSGATALVHAAELTDYTDHGFELRGARGVIRFERERLHLYQAQAGRREPESGFQWRYLQPCEVTHPAPASSYAAALEELTAALEGRRRIGERRARGTPLTGDGDSRLSVPVKGLPARPVPA